MFEVFDHTADLGLRIEAETFESLLIDAAQGLYSMMVVRLDTIDAVDIRRVEISWDLEKDRATLLFDWLNELLFQFETTHFLGAKFEVQVHDTGLSATCRGESMDLDKHDMDHEVKAITYHDLWVAETPQGWKAEVIVDI